MTAKPVHELRRISAHMGATEAIFRTCALLRLSGQHDAATLVLSKINTLQAASVQNVMDRTPRAGADTIIPPADEPADVPELPTLPDSWPFPEGEI